MATKKKTAPVVADAMDDIDPTFEDAPDSTQEEKDALIDAVDTMLNPDTPGTGDTKEKDPPFINCKEFHLVSVSAQKNRKYRIVGSADGAMVSDTITQSHALGTTDLERSYNLVCGELVSKLFPNNPDALITHFEHKTKQNKRKEPIAMVAATAEDDTGEATITLKSKPIEVNLLGAVFSTHYNGLQLEVLNLLRESRCTGGVQTNLFNQPAQPEPAKAEGKKGK